MDGKSLLIDFIYGAGLILDGENAETFEQIHHRLTYEPIDESIFVHQNITATSTTIPAPAGIIVGETSTALSELKT